MQRYIDAFNKAKAEEPGILAFVKVGDFYETFGDDARTVAQLLDIALTTRGDVPMCGVPAHSAKAYFDILR
jgi:DNA mismatch repair protein MutS